VATYKFKERDGSPEVTLGGEGAPPIPHFPTIPPEHEIEGNFNDSVHRRHGIIMGIIDHGRKQVWTLKWQFLTATEVGYIQTWENKRTFQFDPGDSNYHTVYATGKSSAVTAQRGDFYHYTLTLEEM